MIVWGSVGKKPRWVEGGEFTIRKCPECGETREFRECIVKRSLTLYSVIKLWEGGEYRAWGCIGCGSVMALDDTHAPELSSRDRRKLERQEQRKLVAAKREQAEAERERAEAEAERKRRRERQRKDRQRQEAATKSQVEDELAAIKRRLGKS